MFKVNHGEKKFVYSIVSAAAASRRTRRRLPLLPCIHFNSLPLLFSNYLRYLLPAIHSALHLLLAAVIRRHFASYLVEELHIATESILKLRIIPF